MKSLDSRLPTHMLYKSVGAVQLSPMELHNNTVVARSHPIIKWRRWAVVLPPIELLYYLFAGEKIPNEIVVQQERVRSHHSQTSCTSGSTTSCIC